MDRTLEPGSERATYGGAGFISRQGTHAEDVRGGQVWTACGTRSEVAPLRTVLLSWPGRELAAVTDPEASLFLDRVTVPRIQEETLAIADYFRSRGVTVRVFSPPSTPPPNLIFMRDTFFATEEGAIIGRMGAQQRAGEERFASQALAGVGVPVLATLRADATFEGADALWIDPQTVLVGVGRRTNDAGYRQVKAILHTIGARTVRVPMPGGVQHLLGLVNFVDEHLAVISERLAPRRLREILAAHGFRSIALPANREFTNGRAMNFVTISPMHVVMPAGNPETRARLQCEGITCDEICVDEYLKAAGGLGCLTGIVHRDAIGSAVREAPQR